MIRGTTPTHVFNLPIDTEIIKALRITYAQFGRNVVEKTLKDVRLEGNAIRLTLSREETLLFRTGSPVSWQMEILTVDEVVLANRVQTVSVDVLLNEEALE